MNTGKCAKGGGYRWHRPPFYFHDFAEPPVPNINFRFIDVGGEETQAIYLGAILQFHTVPLEIKARSEEEGEHSPNHSPDKAIYIQEGEQAH